MEADARRESEVNRVRYAAHKHNVKVIKTVLGVQQQYADMYWQLDSKLQAADRRREDIVSHIRAKAQEHSARVQQVTRSNEVKTKTLNQTITECLSRASKNRTRVLHEKQSRTGSQNARVEHNRKAQAAEASKAQMAAFWSIDRKLDQAARRRGKNLDDIRERASSPDKKGARIRENFEADAETKTNNLAYKLSLATARKQGVVETVKAKAHTYTAKVEHVTLEQVRKVSDLDAATSLRQRKADEKRTHQLDEVRRQQQRRALKAERVRQTKRMLDAQLE